MMKTWAKRPVEIAHLLNPAFCSILLSEAIDGYCNESETEMPYVLSFLILPIILHKPTRDLLPRSISTKLHAWIQDNQSAHVGFAERVRWTIPYTKEAIAYATAANSILISEEGKLSSIKKRKKIFGLKRLNLRYVKRRPFSLEGGFRWLEIQPP
jgi:hypothetical protein